MAVYNGGLSIKNVSIGTATGSGNAITSLSADGNVITPDKGSTFLTAQDISSKEDKSNKVTAWSSTTTDAHYPSEKLVKSALDTKVNTANVLTLKEIQAATNLTGKVASAEALKKISNKILFGDSGFIRIRSLNDHTTYIDIFDSGGNGIILSVSSFGIGCHKQINGAQTELFTGH